MDRRENNLVFFLVFFGITFLIILLGELGAKVGTTEAFSNFSWKISSFFSIPKNQTSETARLDEENLKLRRIIMDDQNLIAENKALRDQFSTTAIIPTTLIPARVVGSPGFIPGITNPDYLILDKGENDGIKLNDAVVYQDNFVGKIVALSSNYSKVEIALNIDLLTAKIFGESGASGVVKGKGNTLILDNVLLSENLKRDEIVLTKGDIDGNGIGVPPDLVIGKIISIEKRPSNLFQRAEIQSFLDFKNLSTVFVIK